MGNHIRGMALPWHNAGTEDLPRAKPLPDRNGAPHVQADHEGKEGDEDLLLASLSPDSNGAPHEDCRHEGHEELRQAAWHHAPGHGDGACAR